MCVLVSRRSIIILVKKVRIESNSTESFSDSFFHQADDHALGLYAYAREVIRSFRHPYPPLSEPYM